MNCSAPLVPTAGNATSVHIMLNAIGSLHSRFIGAVPMSTLFKETLEYFRTLTDSEYGFIGEFLATGDQMPYLKIHAMSDAVWSKVSRDFHTRHAPIGLEFYNLDNVFGTVLKTGKPLIANDFSATEPGAALPMGHPPIRSLLALPICHGEETLGIIGLANRPDGYDETLVPFLAPLSAVCGSLIGATRADQWRRGAESELRRQAMVFDNISDAVILTEHDGIIVDCNAAAVAILGRPKRNLLGVPLGFSLSFSSDAADPARVAIAAVDRDGHWKGLLAVRRNDGRQRLWETTVLPLHDDVDGHHTLVWFNRDITERHAALSTLAERTQELNTLAELSPDGFVFIDRNRLVTYVNPAFEAMTGLQRTAVLGLSREAFGKILAGLCEAGLPPLQDDSEDEGTLLTLVRPKPTILKRTRRCLRDESGKSCGTVQYYRDVSQETEVDRMKSEFLSMAAHELRTPMSSIFGFTDLLLQRSFSPERQREFLQIIHRQAQQLVSLVNELLDLARIEARAGKDFRISAHDLGKITRYSVAELFLPEQAARIKLELPTASPQVLADPDKLQLAIVNVLNNAEKYSRGRGHIEVSIRERVQDGLPQAGVRVMDQGIGMTPEEVARVFERFFRADASGEIPGTGLGMSIVKEIMTILNGTVDIASQFGKGTDVTLWLPVAAEAPAPAEEKK